MTKKILLIIEQIDTFEQFFASQIHLENVEVWTPYKAVSNRLTHNIRAISKRLSLSFIHEWWLQDWAKQLENYREIIVFDNALTSRLLAFIKTHKPKTTHLKVWLWNVPNANIEELKKEYDVYCFDQKYSKKHGLTFVEQFYILDQVDPIRDSKIRQDYYFIGAEKGRWKALKSLASQLEKADLSYLFHILGQEQPTSLEGVHFLEKALSYDEVIRQIKASKVIVELNKKGQEGLTLRALEALFYGKKLLTNNPKIKDYDFYHPDNILIWDGQSALPLLEFMAKPYVLVDAAIINHYSFSHWLKTITS